MRPRLNLRGGLLLALLLTSAVQAQEPERPPTLDEYLARRQLQPVETPPAGEAPPVETAPTEAAPPPEAPLADVPAPEAPAVEAPPAEAEKPKTLIEALEAAGLDPKTKVEAGNIQVVQGQRAVFVLDAKGEPVLAEIDTGKLAAALPDGEAETYKGSGAGRVGVALDSSPAKRQSAMKVWNGLAKPIAFELELAAIRGGQLMRRKVDGCAIPAGGAHSQVWPYPIIAVTVSKVAVAARDATPCS